MIVTANISNRTYDGTTALTINGTPTLSGWKDGETLSKTYANVFTAGSRLVANSASKNAGTWRVGFTGLTLKPNYITAGYVLQFAPATVTIDQKTLTVTADVASRAYDGTRDNLTLSNVSVSGWLAADDDSIKTLAGATHSGTLVGKAASKDIGTRAVTFSGLTIKTTVGTYGNYKFDYATNKTVTITQKELTLKWADLKVNDKVYNGSNFAPVALKQTGNQKGLTGVVGDEKVTLNIAAGAFYYADTGANVGTNTKVLLGFPTRITFSGDDAGNYKLSSSHGMSSQTPLRGNITHKILTLKADDFQSTTKTYDGGTTATVKLKATGSPKGYNETLIGSDNITLTVEDGAFVYASQNVHGSIQLNVDDSTKLKLSGTGAGNYKFNYAKGADSGLKGAITARTLTLNLADLEVDDRQYIAGDVKAPVKVSSGKTGFTTATATTGVVGNDDVKLNIAQDAFKICIRCNG